MARIMVIDDNENIRETLSEILALHDYEVATACDGNEALALMEKQVPDLVITDLIMPERGGIATIKEMRQKYPEVKIFAVSGGWVGRKEQFLKSAQDAGAIRSFAKPVNWADLKKAVEEVLG
ncbi:MAG: response regulator [Chitinivibrionales bacterium]|nr:response regulator [Chitinivibrionales bacterium]MBD3396704.1 response regulator [Chitinivibrionales bacterium]